MCGIAGIFAVDGGLPPDAEDRVAAMLDAMRHRGPDGEGLLASGRAVLGAVRLAIIDPRPEGDQPIANEDGSVTVVFNGEIYNHAALRKRLEKQGHTFRTRTDTEVLVHLYEEHDLGMVRHLRGMFAFALHDAARDRVLLARDPFGVKPLYTARHDGALFCASEVRALVAAGLGLALDRDAVGAYLATGSVPAPRTILAGVRSLLPGQIVVLDGAGSDAAERTYWTPDLTRSDDGLAWTDAVARLRNALDDSVRAHLVSDVPVGLFLSGGVDSAALAAGLARLGRPDVRAHTLGFEEGDLNESKVAAEVAGRLGLDHHVEVVSGRDAAGMVPAAVSAMDQPTVDGINTYLVARALGATGGRVALSGLGGDELLAGYGHTRTLARLQGPLRAVARTGMGRAVAPLLRSAGHGSLAARAGKVLDAGSADVPALYAAARTVLDPERLKGLGAPAPPADLFAPPSPGGHPIKCLMEMEVRNYMANQLLRDTDAMAMAHSVEARVPFLDRGLFAAAAGLPADLLLEDLPKGLLRATLPDDVRVVVPRDKRGFTLPFDRWVQGALREVVDHGLDVAAEAGLFDRAAARELVESHAAGRAHWSHVWAPAVLGLWLDDHRERMPPG